jgi:hypothetical protein
VAPAAKALNKNQTSQPLTKATPEQIDRMTKTSKEELHFEVNKVKKPNQLATAPSKVTAPVKAKEAMVIPTEA